VKNIIDFGFTFGPLSIFILYKATFVQLINEKNLFMHIQIKNKAVSKAALQQKPI